MKPKTKLQREVIGVSAQLRPLDDHVLEWAAASCLDHIGYATKSRVICLDCGGRFSTKLISRKQAVCPNCGTRIKIEPSQKRTHHQRVYVAFAEIYGDFQVIRHFEIHSHHKDGEKTGYMCHEILQHFVLPSGKCETVGRNHTTNWYVDSWNGDMEIRKNYRRYYNYNAEKYEIYPYKYHPDSVFKPCYRMYGIDHRLEGITFLEAIKTIPNNPIAETLLKTKQYGLLALWESKMPDIRRYWPSIKICYRRGYKIKDVKMWLDHVDLLAYFGKDLRSTKYICPANLKKAHDRLVAKKLEVQRARDLERKKKQAAEDEKRFREMKGKFFGIEFTDGLIRVSVIDNVVGFVEEGDKLHHCVFANEYHLKPDSLILSARINDEPIETVEVSLKTFKVVQSRGKHNGNSPHHDAIVNLVDRNRHLIRRRMRVGGAANGVAVN